MPDSHAQFDQAVAILRRGGLVVFATETVYGLGADATNADAVERIYRAKGRPGTNPLIVHVANVESARRYARHWPNAAEKLARAFWPGPITLVVPKAMSIVDNATAGLDSVGLRAPSHPLALELLQRFDGPIAAPSANRSNRISPTTAEHVRSELGAAVDLILDGGPCAVGIESTVLSLVGEPTILRPGGVSRQQIESVIGSISVMSKSAGATEPALSPGQQAVHYSPTTPAYYFAIWNPTWLVSERNVILSMRNPDSTFQIPDSKFQIPGARFQNPILESGILNSDSQIANRNPVRAVAENIAMPSNAAEYARRLYAALHQADAGGFDRILIELPPDDSAWQAVRDRIFRAARPL